VFVCDDFKAPIDCDFLGGSNNIWLSLLDGPATFRTLGHTNCKRYSVLNLDIVFLNIPLDSPAFEGEKKRKKGGEKREKTLFKIEMFHVVDVCRGALNV
jgi:hypothetical protein